ncbi:MAG: plasmid replication initiator [Oxalobacteraceae bacterium]|nr:MAG: plasmid replication initiator [Oxalobacteraceae bacterium]
MGDVHKLIEQHGAEAVRRMDLPRAVVDAAAGYMSAEERDLFLFTGWAQAALPHRKLADDAHWEISNDHVTLIVQPGLQKISGEVIPIGVPYGSRARLILLYLQTEALRLNSREVELGRSMNHWLSRLGVPLGGEGARSVRDQANRLSRCRLTFELQRGGRSGLLNQNIVDSALFLSSDERQGSLALETARLSEGFFNQLKAHAMPVDEAAIRQISNNSLAIDVYLWLAFRLRSLAKPTPITWRSMKAQFGQGVNRLDNFRTHYRKALDLALSVYPEAKVEEDASGVTLFPSRPPVSPTMIGFVTSKRLAV